MLKQLAVVTILAASLAAAGCSKSDEDVTLTGPSALQVGSGAEIATLTPTVTAIQLSGTARCPDVHPLRIRPNLTIRSVDEDTLFINEIRMRFTDRFGVTAPQVTLPAPVLTTQYGTALINAREARTFPLDFNFGCGTGRTGTLAVLIVLRDGRGRDRTVDLRAVVV
jgi:hypothetical protein